MRKHIIGLVFLGLIFSCSRKPENDTLIRNIWIGDHHLTLYFDSTQSIYFPLPVILDLTDSDHAMFKYFAGDETRITWSIDNGILTIDTTKYRIIALTTDSLVYSPYLKENLKPDDEPSEYEEISIVSVRDEYYVFKRVKEYKHKKTDTNIADYFMNKLFYNSSYDSTMNYGDYLDFLDNEVVIFKMQSGTSPAIHLQEECWRIEQYKGYSFLFFYHSWIKGNGFTERAHQILNLNDDGFTLDRFPGNKQSDYILADPEKDDLLHAKMIGKWISINDTSKFYNRHLPLGGIKSGIHKLYNDTLTYHFFTDSLSISGKGFLPIKCNWRLNSDNSILIYEHLVERDGQQALHVEFARIHNFENDLLELELYENHISTGLKKPGVVILNRDQRFIKLNE
jgi:hypothetical protein